MDHFKTNIALIPKLTGAEKALGQLIVGLMFIPFAVGIFTQNIWLLLSLPMGFLIFFIFNRISKGKFNPKNWVQKDFLVEFTLSGIKIIGSTTLKDFPWADIEGLQLHVEGFDGEAKSLSKRAGRYTGTENRLIFSAHSLQYEFNFYLKNTEQKEALELFLRQSQVKAAIGHITFKESLYLHSGDGNSFKPLAKQAEVPKSKKVSGCLILFATPFVLIGVAAFILPLYQFGKVIQAKEWTPVKAKVLSVDMISSSDPGSTSRKVEMEYEYVAGSETIIGNTVSFNLGMDNVEHYGDLYNSLSRSQVIEIYVNESDPAESVVIRGVTNAMIGVFIFSLMWNSLLLIFALPILFDKTKLTKVLVITVVIWVLGMSKFIFRIGDIDISRQVSVIEVRE